MPGCNRFVWNKALALQKERLRNKERLLSYNELAGLLLEWKEEFPFLAETPSQTLQQTLKDLDKALKEAFDKTNPKQFPVFKKRGQGRDSFWYPQGFQIKNSRVFLPKLGWIGFRRSCHIKGTAKNIAVSREIDHWYVSIQVEMEVEQPVHPSRKAVGIDVGVSKLIAQSDGKHIPPMNAFKKAEKKLVSLQRALGRKVKFSQNWHKQVKKIQKLHGHISHMRSDYLHKGSTMISQNHAIVCMEDLQVRNMTKSAKGEHRETRT